MHEAGLVGNKRDTPVENLCSAAALQQGLAWKGPEKVYETMPSCMMEGHSQDLESTQKPIRVHNGESSKDPAASPNSHKAHSSPRLQTSMVILIHWSISAIFVC